MFHSNDKEKPCLEGIPIDCDYRKKPGDHRGEIYYISSYGTMYQRFGISAGTAVEVPN